MNGIGLDRLDLSRIVMNCIGLYRCNLGRVNLVKAIGRVNWVLHRCLCRIYLCRIDLGRVCYWMNTLRIGSWIRLSRLNSRNWLILIS